MNRSLLLTVRYSLCILQIFFCMPAGLYAQHGEALLKDPFNAYSQQVLQEKLYVHTDKNFYLAGEICWFKIYNTDGFFNKPLGMSKLAYVEVLDKNNQPVLQAKIPLNEGNGNGSLQWPASLASGHYLFRAYTSWMKNFSPAFFFEKQVTVMNTRKNFSSNTTAQKTRFDVQFFPEGGNLVNGLQSMVAFRVTDQYGRGQACSGVVVNEKADTVARYTSLKFGMGSFLFTPVAGHTYKAVTSLPDSIRVTQALPQAYNNGWVMHMGRKNNGQLNISVKTADTSDPATLYLFAHTRGAVKTVAVNTLQHGYAEFVVDTQKLGDGITHFSIFNEQRQPVCERLYFKMPAQPLNITAATDLPVYELRKKVNIGLVSNSRDGKPLPASMSMAVYRVDSLTMPDEMDISSYLWLCADIAGHIESPGYYFSNPNDSTAAALDNLLLTQGWRRFRWDTVFQRKHPVFEFAPEFKGHIIKARVTSSLTGLPVKGAECFLSVAGTRTQFRGDVSDDSGFVKFEMNNFYGNNEVIVQTAQDDSLKHIEIISPYAVKYSGTVLPEFLLPLKNADALYSQHVSMQVQQAYQADKLKQWLMPAIDTLPFYVKPDAAYQLDDYVRFTTIEEILREYVPAVNVRRREGKYYFPVFDNIRQEFFTVDPLVLLR